MNELKAMEYQGQRVIDSRDVAEMVEKPHYELRKSIRTYVGHLAEGEIPVGSFFIESSYIDIQNQERPNYLVTRKGCDMIANKLTGKKGVLFTAAYVTAFEEMQEQLQRHCAPEISPGGLADLIRITRRVMLDMGGNAADVGQAARSLFQTWNVPVPPPLTRQLSGQLNLFDSPAVMLEEG